MGDDQSQNDSVFSLARALGERIRWELEHGVEGYPRTIMSSTSAAATSPSAAATVDEAHPTTTTTVDSGPPTVPPPAERQMPPAEPSPRQVASETDPAAALDALRAAIGDCRRCALHTGRTHLVFGEGAPGAEVVFVGEGPGHDEDMVGRPFVGAAGQLLDRIIKAMGLSRDQVYICNVVKCRPPNNRVPEPSERKICGAFLWRQLSVIRPRVAVALGATAASYLLNTDVSIGRLRGRFHTVDGLKVMPTFHPAYLLRNPSAKREVWHDIQQVMSTLGIGENRGKG